MKENLKIALLAVIALGTMINTYQLSSLNEREADEAEEAAESGIVANNVATTEFQPTTNPTVNNNVPIEAPQPAPPVDMKKTSIRWEKMVHDFGKIKQNSTNKYSFSFVNTGAEPLLITNAVGSCGCTVPDYPKEPIAPGKSAVINVEYKPGQQENQQEKVVTVTANTDPMQTQLKIRAFVEK